MLFSQFDPPSPTPDGQTSLSSASVYLFLPSKKVHQFNHFSRFHSYALIYDICLYLSDLFQFSSVQSLSRVRLCDPMNCSTPGLNVHHQLLDSTQTYVHWVSDAIQPSHLLLFPSTPALNLSQSQGLSKWYSSSHQVAKVLEFLLQHQSFQWTPRTDLL